MRSVLFAAILCALVLAACSNSTPEPTATPIPPTEAPTNEVVVPNSPLGTLAATAGVSLSLPGTLTYPDLAATPGASDATFDIHSVAFVQDGGIASTTLTIKLQSDGTLTRDGNVSTVSQEDVQKIAKMLNDIRFYDIQGLFTNPGRSADSYRYALAVDSTAGSRTILTDDGMTPPELSQIYDAMRSLGGS